jgi:hypothetical protein
LILGLYENQVLYISQPDPQHTSTSNGRLSYHLIITDDSFFHSDGVGKRHAKAHKKSCQKGGKRYTRAGMLRRYTTSSFSGYSTCYRPRCYKSEGKAVACSLPRKHIYPLHHHSRTQTRGRSNTASLANTFDSSLSLSSLLDQHVLRTLFFLHLPMPRAWVAHYRKETSWTRGMVFSHEFHLCSFWQG